MRVVYVGLRCHNKINETYYYYFCLPFALSYNCYANFKKYDRINKYLRYCLRIYVCRVT